MQNISTNNEKVKHTKTIIITKWELNKTSKWRNYINQIDNIQSKINHNENQLRNLDKRLDDLLKSNNIKNKDILNILVYWQSTIKISLMNLNIDEKRIEVLEKNNLTTKNIYDKINIQFNDKTRYLTWNKINWAEIYLINFKAWAVCIDCFYFISDQKFYIPIKFHSNQNIEILSLNSNYEIIWKENLSFNLWEEKINLWEKTNRFEEIDIQFDWNSIISWQKNEWIESYEIQFSRLGRKYIFNISWNENKFIIPNVLKKYLEWDLFITFITIEWFWIEWKKIEWKKTIDPIVEEWNIVNPLKLWVGVSNITSSNMDFSLSEKQNISFLFSFDEYIYKTPGRETLVNKNDTFWFRITNLASWKTQNIPNYWQAFPWTKHTINLSSDFFWDKNWRHQIRIEAISNNIYVYSDYYNKGNITEFNIDIKWIWTSKKIWIWETQDNCKTILWTSTYILEPCLWINIELVKWMGDKKFNFKIKANKLLESDIYTNIYWNKEKIPNNFIWFPKNSLRDSNTSWVKYNDYIEFEYVIKNNNIPVWNYNWTLHIWIKKWDTEIKNWLNLPLKVTMKENFNKGNIDYCKTEVWDTVLYLEPCQLEIIHIKWSGNKEFSFEVKSSDWKKYSYSILWNLENINAWLDYVWMPRFSVRWWWSNWTTWSSWKEYKYFVDDIIDIWTYNTFVYVVPNEWGYNWIEYRELRLPIKLVVKDNWENKTIIKWDNNNYLQKDFNNTNNYCTTEINWITYSLEPCKWNYSMKDWNWNKEFSFKINTWDSKEFYWFDIYWFVEWFPRYWIIDIIGWWAEWNKNITLKFNDKFLDKWNYSWYLKIFITKNNIEKELRFYMDLTVN